jgi:hypothetical protein
VRFSIESARQHLRHLEPLADRFKPKLLQNPVRASAKM